MGMFVQVLVKAAQAVVRDEVGQRIAAEVAAKAVKAVGKVAKATAEKVRGR